MRRTLFILIVLIGIFLLTDFIYYSYWRSTLRTIDSRFDGLYTARSDRTVRLLVVHGIGKHCIGYSHHLGQGLADALGLQTGSSSKSFHAIVQALDDEPRQKARSEWLTRTKQQIKQQYGYDMPLKEVLNQQQIEIPPEGLPLLDDNCKPTFTPEYMNIEEDSNAFENVQNETCRAIHNRKTEDSMDCQIIKLKFKYPTSVEGGFGPPPGTEPAAILGYIRMRDYSYKDHGVPSLRVYELTWDRTTRTVKDWYLLTHDRSSAGWLLNDRWWLNRAVKSTIVNDSISDAVLYFGIYRPLFQYVILQGFCKLISDEKDVQGEDFDCLSDINNILSKDEFSKSNDLAIVTHSLGTRIVFDVLGRLGHEKFFNKLRSDLTEKNEAQGFTEMDSKILERVNRLKVVFARSLSKLFVLTNQVPLLELGEITNPFDLGSEPKMRDLGLGFRKFLEFRQLELREAEVPSPLQIVTFTDPNDLLSYNLKCWYDQHILRWRKHVANAATTYDKKTGKGTRTYYEKVFTCPPPRDGEWLERYEALWKDEKKLIHLVNVFVGFRGIINFRPVVADPRSAHSRYFWKDESLVHRLIACGGDAPRKLGACPKL